MVSGPAQKRSKRTKSKRTQKAMADAAKIAEKRQWRFINFDKESFRRHHAIREKRHLCFNLRKAPKASLLGIFLKFLPNDFVTRIANDIPEIDLRYFNGWCLRLSLGKIYSILAVKGHIYGGQYLSVGVTARTRPFRLHIEAYRTYFGDKF